MASARKSGIPVMKAGKTQNGSTSQTGVNSLARSSGIPRRVKNSDSVKPDSPVAALTSPSHAQEGLKEQVARLQEDVKIKDSTIKDLNDKLVARMREFQILSEEHDSLMEKMTATNEEHLEIAKLENLLKENEILMQGMAKNKQETERKFDVELDILKNQHEIEILTLQERLEEEYGEKLRELEKSLQDEKMVSGMLTEELKEARAEEQSAEEINMLQEELMSTKQRYEEVIRGLKQDLERVMNQKKLLEIGNERKAEVEDVAATISQNGDAVENLKRVHKEELETLKYVLQEKDVIISDLKQRIPTESAGENGEDIMTAEQEAKMYSNEDMTVMLEELKERLMKESEQNIAMANELWRRKFEEEQRKVEELKSSVTRTTNEEETTDDDTSNQQDINNEKKEMDFKTLVKEMTALKEKFEEATDLQEEQAEVLEVQEKEIEELKESNKEYEERYNNLFNEMQAKWQEEFSESEIIEKIKGHYEMEIERLHGDLEELQNENSNLKTELDLMTNDFDAESEGRRKMSGTFRRNSVTARLDLKAEVEDYKVQLAGLERDLQHALNQIERMKMEKGGEGVSGDLQSQEIASLNNRIAELEQELKKLIAERDDFKIKQEKDKKERKRVEKNLKNVDETKGKIEEELKKKCKEIVSLKTKHGDEVKKFEDEIFRFQSDIDKLHGQNKTAKCKIALMSEKLSELEMDKNSLEKKNEELQRSKIELIEEVDGIKKERECLQKRVNQLVEEAKEHEKLNAKFNEKEKDTAEEKKAQFQEAKVLKEKIKELEMASSRSKINYEELEVSYKKSLKESEARNSEIGELKARLSQRNLEYDELKENYEKVLREDEIKSSGNDALETTLRQKNIELEDLKTDFQKVKAENHTMVSRIGELETALSQSEIKCDELRAHCDQLTTDNETNVDRISKMEADRNKNEKENKELKTELEKLRCEMEKQTHGSNKIQAKLRQREMEVEQLNGKYEELERDNEEKASRIGILEREAGQTRKQVLAFEKKIASQEREKKSLEEKNASLANLIDGHEQEISRLKHLGESHELNNSELGVQLGSLRSHQGKVDDYEQRNRELRSLVEESALEKDILLNKQAQLMKENSELRVELDKLQEEKGTLEDTLEKENFERQRKLSINERKVKEKDRVLNETKKESKHLKENLKEMEERCLQLQEELENLKVGHKKEVKKLKGMLDHTKKSLDQKERELTDELVKQRNVFELELQNAKETMKQASHIEVAEITRELQEKLELGYKRDDKVVREELGRLSEENHALKIRVDDLAIEVSKEKEEKYKLEKLKDQFRFQVQNLQENVEIEQEKLLRIQREQMEVIKNAGEDKEKVLAALKEYESKNTNLITEIERASNVLKITKRKYGKLKEKYMTLSKEYTKLNEDKLNKSDVQVGPDDSMDLSLILEDLQRNKDEAELANAKLRSEIGKLREELGRNQYQIKSVRKANVVLMKQSRCLYKESEDNKRVEEERVKDLEKHRRLNETFKEERDILEKEKQLLETKIKELEMERNYLREQCEGYFVTKNKKEVEMEEKNRDCVLHCHQLARLKEENDFLYQQGKKLQAELDNRHKQFVTSRTVINHDENRNIYSMVDVESGRYGPNNRAKETASWKPSTPDSGVGLFSSRSKLSESTDTPASEEPRDSIPVVFNNVKLDEEKILEKHHVGATDRRPGKDTNLQISRNILNNEFSPEKYLGTTYWETLAFLEKK